MICACGQPAVTRVPAIDAHAALCLTHAIEYYAGLVACGAHPCRDPNERRSICRACGRIFTYVPAPRRRSNKTICRPCYSAVRARIAFRSWETRPASTKYPRRLNPPGLEAA